MRKCLLVLVIVCSILPRASAQSTSHTGNSPNRDPSLDLDTPTLRVTTREVLVDLIALDRHNRPVLDLKPGELLVSEAVAESEQRKKHKTRSVDPVAPDSIEPITSLSIFDPNEPSTSASDARTGFRILASCLERSTVHYQLAFHPGFDRWISGFHRIAISTTRPDVKLFYRHQYYVGLAAPVPGNPVLKADKVDQIL
jgi:hypothetical protein